ncbi:bifunctional folylpolyglutamate synthase/dihydrofolate synthase [Fulvivirgaceae bacterium LMO-SS25]
MNFTEVVEYLYSQLPMFQRVGASAFKKDLSNTIALCNYLGNPHRKFKTVHIAGTNGKGSTAHSLAAVLQAAGYKTGLYTSPHLKSFTERIRVNGIEIPEEKVIEFVEKHKPFIEELKPSFFELTVAMAFDHFAQEQVDIAVIEVGMGGRLDSTNVIEPLLSVITNIGLDHKEFLGNTLPEIAFEKAGIIKPNKPVVISQTQPETKEVFLKKAREGNSPIQFADTIYKVAKLSDQAESGLYSVYTFASNSKEVIPFQLLGDYQTYNLPGILVAIDELQKLGFSIAKEAIHQGLANVTSLTGLKGRWQTLSEYPLTICDTGHNEDGIRMVMAQLKALPKAKLHIVIGMVRDKDIDGVLNLLPKDATYYFTQAQIPRAMEAEELCKKAGKFQLFGEAYQEINEAIRAAKSNATNDDVIFIGGSTFVVAEIDELNGSTEEKTI